MMRAQTLGAAIALIFLFPVGSRAQQAVTSPHGDIEAECQSCHSAAGWRPASLEDFDHEREGFALERAHAGLDCTDCHAGLMFAGVSSECGSCHSDVHLGELGSDCDRCHTAHSFIDLAQQRQMHREVSFALTGAHAGADCESCHVPHALGDLQYLGTTTECIDCHRAEYDSATDPDHDQFLERCDACHGTATWAGGFFNHERQLAGTVIVCVDCHQDDYDRASIALPYHLDFPLTCEACHNTRDWRGSFTQHDREYFPIFSGRHAGEWADCNECHSNFADFTVFDCLGCHPHSDKAKTDEQHSEEPDYFYDSVDCYDCHPDGRS